jgi:polar amino acid transport system substrate-binding protein
MDHKKPCFFALLLAFFLFTANSFISHAAPQKDPLKIGVAGSEPFVTNVKQESGISLEIWQAIAGMGNINYKLVHYKDVPTALNNLSDGKLDAVVGPISITPERAQKVLFTQPYYQSSISIMSRKDSPSFFQRIKPFFSIHFFYAILIFVFILAIIGTLLWLAERDGNPEEFSHRPLYGIPDGMWCAIVTMTTTGYGDIAPQSLWGRILAGCWMVIAIVFATTMVAGIASTLSLAASNTKTISQAKQLNHQKVAVVKDSPSDSFINKYGAQPVYEKTLKDCYEALKAQQVAAVVFDRPEMLYFLKKHHDEDIVVSDKRYMRQGYGFAVPLNADSKKLHNIDINLLKLQESGRVDRIINEWLGQNE